MSSERDVTRIVESWLEEGPAVLPDRVLDAVEARLPAIHQRHAGWLTRRFSFMNSTLFRIGAAAAAVIVVAFVGYQLLPGRSVGGPQATPTPEPTPVPTATPAPTTAAFPPRGDVGAGRHSMTLAGVPLSMDFPTAGWISNGQWGLDKGDFLAPGAASFILWPDGAANNVYSDPCTATELDPPAGRSIAELAAAVAGVPGLELVSGPADVTVGGQPAKHVELFVPDTIGCAPRNFWLWYDADDPTGPNARYASATGETFHVWIIDVNGTTVWIDAETWAESGPEADQEVHQIVDSIQFE